MLFRSLRHFGLSNVVEATRKWSANIAACAHLVRPFPEVARLLAELNRVPSGARLGIVTSRMREEYDGDFISHGLHPLFSTVICADDTERHKPAPDPLLAYLERSGAEKGDAIYIGDSGYDMDCAVAAGVDCGHALWGAERGRHPGATYHFASVAELRDLLFS